MTIWETLKQAGSDVYAKAESWFIHPAETTIAIDEKIMKPTVKSGATIAKNIASGALQAFGLEEWIIVALVGGLGVLLLMRKLKI